MTDPLILTAALHPADQERFDALRRRHFPAHLNRLAAHLTMFHHLPGDRLAEIEALLRHLADVEPPCEAAVLGLRSLGRGVAFALECPPLTRLRGAVARAFAEALTAQDRQGWRAHVTVQNKAPPAEAAVLLESMRAAFVPFSVRVAGLSLWFYRGGPWSPAGTFPFASAPLAAGALPSGDPSFS